MKHKPVAEGESKQAAPLSALLLLGMLVSGLLFVWLSVGVTEARRRWRRSLTMPS